MKYGYNIIICMLIGIVIISIMIYLFKNHTKNGFQNYYNTKWSPDLIQRFIVYQKTVNKNANQFDLDQLQQQASPAEAEDYLKNGLWSWPDDLKKLYIEQVWSSPIIKIEPQYALNYAMKIYNQNAVRELLAWNTKEGHFLLYGGDIGVSDGMPQNVNNTIQCSTDSNNNSSLIKKIYTGMNLWNGYMNYKTTNVKPEDIPNEMPGFTFVKSPCNPCVALNSPGDFSCPFKINIKGNNNISEPWKQLWNL